jgi:hypothetical protein
MRILAVLAFLFAGVAAPAAAQPGEPFPDSQMFRQARLFMDAYAEDLRRGDRAGIAARYDRDGAWIVGEGMSGFESHARLTAVYAGAQWQPPHRFEWRNLSYLFTGPDTVLVVGLFLWTPAPDAAPLTYSYTALLVRDGDAMHIRLEHESTGTPPRPAP